MKDRKFPLRMHASGNYCKTIRGKQYYFGKDKKQAIIRYLKMREPILSEITRNISIRLPEQKGKKVTGYVYFVQSAAGPIKIGYSKDPQERIKDIATHNPERLFLLACTPGSLTDERRIHKVAKPYRIRGEWYTPSFPILELIHFIQKDKEKWEQWKKETSDGQE